MNLKNLIRSLVLEEASNIANDKLATMLEVVHAQTLVWPTHNFESRLIQRNAFELPTDNVEKIREHAYRVVWAFEFNKLMVKYQKIVLRHKNNLPKLFWTYFYAFTEGTRSEKFIAAYLLSTSEDEHNATCGTFTRLLDTMSLREYSKKQVLFARRLTPSDEFILNREDRERYSNRKFEILHEYKK